MSTQAITYDDVLLVPNYNNYESRRNVDISNKDKTNKLELALPVLTANMDSVTESPMANFIGDRGGMGVLHRFLSIEENVAEFKKCNHKTFVSVGCSDAEMQRAEALRDAGALYFCVDVAHAHGKYVGKTLKRLREILPNACIMAGNIATYAGADYLSACGADILKVGIGGGSAERTLLLSKKALLRAGNSAHSDFEIVALEAEILERVNKTGIGPQGLGGNITAMACFIEWEPCHIASLPVAVNLLCHSARHAEVLL
jgi:IMP dehydrogenase/GMP reductase